MQWCHGAIVHSGAIQWCDGVMVHSGAMQWWDGAGSPGRKQLHPDVTPANKLKAPLIALH